MWPWTLGCTDRESGPTETGDGGTAPVELAYDDGVGEDAYSPWSDEAGGQVGVHFTGPGPAEIVALRVFVWGELGRPDSPFALRVWDWDAAAGLPGSGSALEIEAQAGAAGGWVEVDLGADPVAVEADFAVAMEWRTAPGDHGLDAQFMAGDLSDPDSRSFMYYPGFPVWRPVLDVAGEDVDFLIRVTLR